MPILFLIRLALLRVLVVVLLAGMAYGLIATVDVLFGTTFIAVLWQWLWRLWLFVLKWLRFLSRFGLRWMPGLAKRFVFRKGLSGISKLANTAFLALLFAALGGERYRRLARWAARSKSTVVRVAVRAWTTELWFFPRWLRACVFIIATIATIIAFAKIQEWAEKTNKPMLFGIDLWSFVFGFVASFVLTNLPLIGFDHFLRIIFRPLQHRYRRFIRRKGLIYVVLNWLIALRPARRRAELERKRLMRRWHAQYRAQNKANNQARQKGAPEPQDMEGRSAKGALPAAGEDATMGQSNPGGRNDDL